MNVLVIGDIIVDRYTHGSKRGLSAETPTVVANFLKEEMFVGGAGLVARNLLRLECDVTLMSGGRDVPGLLRESTDPLTKDEWSRLMGYCCLSDKLQEKRRYYVEDYKLLQYDLIDPNPLNSEEEEYAIFKMSEMLPGHDAVVICDNRHGLLTKRFASRILKLAKRKKIPTYVDSQVSQSDPNHEWYRGSDFIFLNQVEAQVLSEKFGTASSAPMWEISKYLESNIVEKRGPKGSNVWKKGAPYATGHSGFKVNAIDTCGAGDAFMAAFVAKGHDQEFANRWAALSTTYKGTIVPKVEDLKRVKR